MVLDAMGTMNSRRYGHHQNLALRMSPRRARTVLEEFANFIPGFVPPGQALVIATQDQLATLGAKLGKASMTRVAELEVSQAMNRVRILVRRFPEIFSQLHTHFSRAGKETYFLLGTIGVVEHIHRAWREQDPRAREWTIFELRRLWHRLTLKALQVSQPHRLEDVMPAEHLYRERARQKDKGKKVEDYIFWGWWPDSPPMPTAFEQLMVHFQRMMEKARYCANPECPAPYFFAQRRGQKYHKDCAWYGQRQAKKRYWHGKGKRVRAQKGKQKRRL